MLVVKLLLISSKLEDQNVLCVTLVVGTVVIVSCRDDAVLATADVPKLVAIDTVDV